MIRCDTCGAEMAPILGEPISFLGIYREVLGYYCPNNPEHPKAYL